MLAMEIDGYLRSPSLAHRVLDQDRFTNIETARRTGVDTIRDTCREPGSGTPQGPFLGATLPECRSASTFDLLARALGFRRLLRRPGVGRHEWVVGTHMQRGEPSPSGRGQGEGSVVTLP